MFQPSQPLRGKRICLDPGHPSENGVGAQGKRLTEVGVAWRVALRTKQVLQERGAMVKLTKTRENEFVRNRKRAEIANQFAADLMLRLHCDSAGPGVSGTSTYYPNREGRAPDGARGPSVGIREKSTRLAPRLHHALIAALTGHFADRGVMPDTRTGIGAKQGALTGSVYSRVPVVLVEMCVLTDKRDEEAISTAKGEALMALALADGVQAALIPIS